MGGGSSNNTYREDKIESIESFGGQYKDCHILNENSAIEKNLKI
jgi:hypothetical protein